MPFNMICLMVGVGFFELILFFLVVYVIAFLFLRRLFKKKTGSDRKVLMLALVTALAVPVLFFVLIIVFIFVSDIYTLFTLED